MLITVEELESRLNYDLGEAERKTAEVVIVDASNLARAYGGRAWTAQNAPPVVKTMVRNACVRYMNLAESVLLSRAGDETEQYTDLREKTGTVFFTKDEQATIRSVVASRGSIFSAPVYAHSSRRVRRGATDVRVPFGDGRGKLFPFGGGP